MQSVANLSWISGAWLYVYLNRWTVKFKLLYLLNLLSCFNEICRMLCEHSRINVKVWLNFVLPLLIYRRFSRRRFSRGLFFIDAPCRTCRSNLWHKYKCLFVMCVSQVTDATCMRNILGFLTVSTVCALTYLLVETSLCLSVFCLYLHTMYVKQLVMSLDLSRLDYCNSVLFGLLAPLQWAVAMWQRGQEGGIAPSAKFWAFGKLWENFVLVRKFLSKNAKFGAETPIFGEINENCIRSSRFWLFIFMQCFLVRPGGWVSWNPWNPSALGY